MATIKTVLDLDRSKFDASVTLGAQKFQRAFGSMRAGFDNDHISKEAERLGEDVSRKLNRSFGLGDAVKGLLMGAGMASVEKVAEKISEHWRDAAESAKEIANESDRALRATLKLIDMRKTDPQRLADLRKEARKMQAELNTISTWGTSASPDDKKRAAKLDADIKENAVAQAELQKKISEAAIERFKKSNEAMVKSSNEIMRRNEEKARKDEEAERKHQALVKHRVEENEREGRANLARQRREAELLDRKKAIENEILDIKRRAAAEAANAIKPSLTGAAEGNEGTLTQVALARNVMSLQQRAAQVMRAGGNAWRDEKGRPISAADYAARLTDRAKQLAGGTFKSDLSSGTDDKLAKAAEELNKAAEELRGVAEWGDPDPN